MAKDRIQKSSDDPGMKSGPNSMARDAFTGGTVQFTGDKMELSRKTTPMGEFDKGISGGTMQSTGDMMKLNRTPRPGWESYDTPMADTSMTGYKSTAGYPKAGKK